MQAQRERELKFDVPAGWRIPSVDPVVPSRGRVETLQVHLDSVYYDTDARDLLVNNVTLRRREGDTDEGWQLKVDDADARTELRVALNGRGVPDELQELVRGLRAGGALRPVARLTTERTVHRVCNAAGEVVAEIAQDAVTASKPGDVAEIETWRELEVELVAGDERYLKRAAKWLIKSGAKHAASTSKLARALGYTAPAAQPADKTLAATCQVYLDQQYRVLMANDVALRRGSLVVHSTRVASRRYRSVLRIFGDLFDAERGAALDAELAWYAEALGKVRDLQVLSEHLGPAVQKLPPDLVGPAQTRIEETLARELHTARTELERAMNSRRYVALIRELKAWHREPPTDGGQRPPRAELAARLAKAERAIGKRLKAARRERDGHDALHRARKAAKRARYAAELSEPVLGKSAHRSVKQAKRLQTKLGSIQDSVVAADFLRRAAVSARATPGDDGFALGVVWAAEIQRLETEVRAARKL